ncbi:MAG: ATP-binding protein [Desulfobacterales bacterium]|nr:ATP-binding protein [Desulfobacterales bacterium]
MIISIASGKGGTGKTTVATNLSASLGAGLKLLDCDVEEPNAHLFLDPSITGSETVNAPVPEVDETRCTYCKKCMAVCRFGAIAVMGRKVITFPELCHSCGGCSLICPEQAITEADRSIARVETGTLSRLPGVSSAPASGFARGLLDIGQVMAPPVIRQVRTHENPDGLTIIDAPPGTSCPVISAMKGADVVVLVTEPTPFGLHDLVLAVEAVKILGIPHGLVINRAGMGNDEVKEYAAAEGLPVLMEIPFDRKIAMAYSKGELLIHALPEYRKKFLSLYRKISALAGTGTVSGAEEGTVMETAGGVR